MAEPNTILEFITFRGNIWIVMVFVLVCLDLVLKSRMALTVIAVGAFFAAFFARLFMPFYGQVIIFVSVAGLLLWKGLGPIRRWREQTLKRTSQALDYARSLEAVVVDPIRRSTLPGRVLVDGIIMPARSRRPIPEGAAVVVTSAGPDEVWVRPKT